MIYIKTEGWWQAAFSAIASDIKKDLYSQKGSGTQYPLGDKKKGKRGGQREGRRVVRGSSIRTAAKNKKKKRKAFS